MFCTRATKTLVRRCRRDGKVCNGIRLFFRKIGRKSFTDVNAKYCWIQLLGPLTRGYTPTQWPSHFDPPRLFVPICDSFAATYRISFASFRQPPPRDAAASPPTGSALLIAPSHFNPPRLLVPIRESYAATYRVSFASFHQPPP